MESVCKPCPWTRTLRWQIIQVLQRTICVIPGDTCGTNSLKPLRRWLGQGRTGLCMRTFILVLVNLRVSVATDNQKTLSFWLISMMQQLFKQIHFGQFTVCHSCIFGSERHTILGSLMSISLKHWVCGAMGNIPVNLGGLDTLMAFGYILQNGSSLS